MEGEVVPALRDRGIAWLMCLWGAKQNNQRKSLVSEPILAVIRVCAKPANRSLFDLARFYSLCFHAVKSGAGW